MLALRRLPSTRPCACSAASADATCAPYAGYLGRRQPSRGRREGTEIGPGHVLADDVAVRPVHPPVQGAEEVGMDEDPALGASADARDHSGIGPAQDFDHDGPPTEVCRAVRLEDATVVESLDERVLARHDHRPGCPAPWSLLPLPALDTMTEPVLPVRRRKQSLTRHSSNPDTRTAVPPHGRTTPRRRPVQLVGGGTDPWYIRVASTARPMAQTSTTRIR